MDFRDGFQITIFAYYIGFLTILMPISTNKISGLMKNINIKEIEDYFHDEYFNYKRKVCEVMCILIISLILFLYNGKNGDLIIVGLFILTLIYHYFSFFNKILSIKSESDFLKIIKEKDFIYLIEKYMLENKISKEFIEESLNIYEDRNKKENFILNKAESLKEIQKIFNKVNGKIGLFFLNLTKKILNYDSKLHENNILVENFKADSFFFNYKYLKRIESYLINNKDKEKEIYVNLYLYNLRIKFLLDGEIIEKNNEKYNKIKDKFIENEDILFMSLYFKIILSNMKNKNDYNINSIYEFHKDITNICSSIFTIIFNNKLKFKEFMKHLRELKIYDIENFNKKNDQNILLDKYDKILKQINLDDSFFKEPYPFEPASPGNEDIELPVIELPFNSQNEYEDFIKSFVYLKIKEFIFTATTLNLETYLIDYEKYKNELSFNTRRTKLNLPENNLLYFKWHLFSKEEVKFALDNFINFNEESNNRTYYKEYVNLTHDQEYLKYIVLFMNLKIDNQSLKIEDFSNEYLDMLNDKTKEDIVSFYNKNINKINHFFGI